jgi:hypothetical protein
MLGVPRVSDVSHSIPARTAESRHLVVPAEPGPLLDPAVVSGEAAGDRDELDEAFDELFGSDPGSSPGWFDVLLVAGGIALAAWGWLHLDSTAVIAVGAGLAALGSVMPFRAAWRRVKHGRTERRRASVLAQGPIVDAAHPATAELVAAYGALLDATGAAPSSRAAEARVAAHAAVLESASLLEGGPPETPAQLRYVERRVEAIAGLTDALTRPAENAVAAGPADPRREARTEAHEELESIGASSLTELAELTELLRQRT